MTDQKTKVVYFDESGDNGMKPHSSNLFILTSLCISAEKWQDSFDLCRSLRKHLRKVYGFSLSHEIHTKPFLHNKYPFSKYEWSPEERRRIIRDITDAIVRMDVSIVNVVIDKRKLTLTQNVLELALTYNIQRIENTFGGDWNYIVITDPGKTGTMKRTARKIRNFNPIPTGYGETRNEPIQYMIEDIMEKDSRESYFIQLCDFVSYFVNMYYKIAYQKETIMGRPAEVVSEKTVLWVMERLKESGALNTKASRYDRFGVVVAPR